VLGSRIDRQSGVIHGNPRGVRQLTNRREYISNDDPLGYLNLIYPVFTDVVSELLLLSFRPLNAP
jgi:hypothetical protein